MLLKLIKRKTISIPLVAIRISRILSLRKMVFVIQKPKLNIGQINFERPEFEKINQIKR